MSTAIATILSKAVSVFIHYVQKTIIPSIDGTDVLNEGKNSSEDKNTMKAFWSRVMKEFYDVKRKLYEIAPANGICQT